MFVITVTEGPDEVPAAVDVNPHRAPNVIKLRSNGQVHVAVFTTVDFDAAAVDVSDLSTIRFGDSNLDEPARVSPNHAKLRDVDDDGDDDLVLRFSLKDIKAAGALVSTSTDAALTGLTTDGVPIRGTESVEIFQPGRRVAIVLRTPSKPRRDDRPGASATAELSVMSSRPASPQQRPPLRPTLAREAVDAANGSSSVAHLLCEPEGAGR